MFYLYDSRIQVFSLNILEEIVLPVSYRNSNGQLHLTVSFSD